MREASRKFPRFRAVLAVWHSRIRTGDCGLLAGTPQQPAFVSLGTLSGSDSLSIRDWEVESNSLQPLCPRSLSRS